MAWRTLHHDLTPLLLLLRAPKVRVRLIMIGPLLEQGEKQQVLASVPGPGRKWRR